MSQMRAQYGDDLRFLGLALVLAARHQIRPKPWWSDPVTHPTSEADALRALQEGLEMGWSVPLDDVPAFKVSVDCADRAALRRFMRLAMESGDDVLAG